MRSSAKPGPVTSDKFRLRSAAPTPPEDSTGTDPASSAWLMHRRMGLGLSIVGVFTVAATAASAAAADAD